MSETSQAGPTNAPPSSTTTTTMSTAADIEQQQQQSRSQTQKQPPTYPFPLPEILTHCLTPSSSPRDTYPELITQGAEGRLYKTTYLTPSLPCALKHRPTKPWRHPTLDARLTRHRILSEARILAKCRREGVPVPAVYALDEVKGWLMLEWVEGGPVRVSINAWLDERKRKEKNKRRRIEGGGGGGGGAEEGGVGGGNADADADAENADDDHDDAVSLMRKIGLAVGGLHRVGVIHGDLTTSNMMLRPPGSGQGGDDEKKTKGKKKKVLDGEIVVIDFGLASQGTAEEDRAVDLYVLERAFGSTHPSAEDLFAEVLDAYKTSFKGAPVVLKRLDEVRMRGRKRSMLG